MSFNSSDWSIFTDLQNGYLLFISITHIQLCMKTFLQMSRVFISSLDLYYGYALIRDMCAPKTKHIVITISEAILEKLDIVVMRFLH